MAIAGETMIRRLRRAYAATVIAVLLLPAAAAQAQSDDEAFPPGGPVMTQVMLTAQQYWGAVPCDNQVAIEWSDLAPDVYAISTWQGAPGAPASTYTSCGIAFNRKVHYDSPQLCTVMLHEVGHLLGNGHSSDEASPMYPYYTGPFGPCAPASPALQPGPVAHRAPRRRPGARRRRCSPERHAVRRARRGCRSRLGHRMVAPRRFPPAGRSSTRRRVQCPCRNRKLVTACRVARCWAARRPASGSR